MLSHSNRLVSVRNTLLIIFRNFSFSHCCMFGLFLHTDRAVPPSFTKTLKKMDGNIGSNATLECRVAGSQPMVVSWFKDEKEICNSDKYKLDFSESAASVTITKLDQSDGGVYKCQASNKAGENETSGTLTVKGQRRFNTLDLPGI